MGRFCDWSLGLAVKNTFARGSEEHDNYIYGGPGYRIDCPTPHDAATLRNETPQSLRPRNSLVTPQQMRRRSYFGGAIVLPIDNDYENPNVSNPLPGGITRFRIFNLVFAASDSDRKCLKTLSSQIASLVMTNILVFMTSRIANQVITSVDMFVALAFYLLSIAFITIIDPVVFLAFYSVFRQQMRQFFVRLIQ